MSMLGECGYCGRVIEDGGKTLPLECAQCQRVFHHGCLRGQKPRVFLGDQLFFFTCAHCDPVGLEQCSRPNLQWVHVIHLALYNLMVQQEGRRGFFRWNDDICNFLQAHWQDLMPGRKKTQSWHSTVAGTLSVHCPTLFLSGFKLFGEHGWWSLASLAPPCRKGALGVAGEGKLPVKRSLTTLPEPPAKRFQPEVPERSKRTTPLKPLLLDSPTISFARDQEMLESHNDGDLPGSSGECVGLPSERQEAVLLEHLLRYQEAVRSSSKASRLLRKLKVRDSQRKHGITPFNLDAYVCQTLAQTVKYVIDNSKPYYEQIGAVPCRDCDSRTESCARDTRGIKYDGIPSSVEVLSRLTKLPVLAHSPPQAFTQFQHYISGGKPCSNPITSPYTARALKPYIFRSLDIKPAKARLLEEIVQCHSEKRGSEIARYAQQSVDFCYFQEHHLQAVNALVSHFFWPVNLSECLQYPDFTVVVLYGKLVIGCGFMTPDVKVNEAYISFLVVHPDFRGAGIGKMMLYHLIQTCMGKDVTLHVSIDNPAMLLYQQFGFKAQQYCLDFYERYYPTVHPLSKHAYFMRLRR